MDLSAAMPLGLRAQELLYMVRYTHHRKKIIRNVQFFKRLKIKRGDKTKASQTTKDGKRELESV